MVDTIGPFSDGSFIFTIDGYRVPYIRGWIKPEDESLWDLSFEKPGSCDYGATCDDGMWRHLLPFVANAMAACAGWTSFGAGSVPANPFHNRAHLVVSVEEEEIPLDEGPLGLGG